MYYLYEVIINRFMQYRQGQDRDQMFLTSMSEFVAPDSWARIVDLFVNSLPMATFGFKNATLNTEGNIPYCPSDMFKLFLYGYRKRIRSAKQLEEACIINLEIIWLLKGLRPSARTINYFRSNNGEAIEKAHKHFVRLLKSWKLIDGDLIAVDSMKVRAQNSLKNNFNQKKIDRHIEYIDSKMQDYFDEWEDVKNSKIRGKKKKLIQIEEKINALVDRREHYDEVQEKINASHDGQVSVTDPDARAVILHRNIVQVGYNIQMTADAKHNFIIDCHASGVNDLYSLSEAAHRAKEVLQVDKSDILADKGYYNGIEIARSERMGMRPFVAPRDQAPQSEEGYNKSDFIYNKKEDTYTCPAGQTLSTNGQIYVKGDKQKYKFRRYMTKACATCPLAANCTTNQRGRQIERSLYQNYVDRNDARFYKYYQTYRLRQQVIEPIFGIFKRQWDLDYTILKTKEKVLTEYRIAGLAYNLMRLVTEKGINWVQKRLKKLIFCYFPMVSPNRTLYTQDFHFLNFKTLYTTTPHKVLYLSQNAVVA
jgi:transposase